MNKTDIRERITELTEQLNFEGVDVSLDISLFEYGILTKPIRTYKCSILPDDEVQVIAVTAWNELEDPLHYDVTTIHNDFFNDMFDESWFEVDSFLSFVGMDEETFMDSHAAIKLSDMIAYYGTENILGSNCYPLTDSDLLEWLNDEVERENKTEVTQ